MNVVQAYGHHCAGSAREIKPDLSASAREGYEKKLSEAKTAYTANPSDAEAIIWFGRRTAYLGEYKAAIKIFTDGMAKFPNDARFYRHRGHRLITLRCFDDAVADFEKASKLIAGKPDEVEPDGMPNAKNISDKYAAIEYLVPLGPRLLPKGRLQECPSCLFHECIKVSKNNDMSVASAYWRYMTLRRLGRDKDAARVLEKFAAEDRGHRERTIITDLIKLNRGPIKG